jgi:hypothetical protein
MKLIPAFSLMLLATGFASAGTCYTPVRVHHPYVAPVVHHVKKVVVAEVVAVPILQFGVIAYGGGYNAHVPPVVNAAPVAPAEDLRKRQTFEEQVIAGLTQLNKNTNAISDDVQSLKARVAEVERRTGTLPTPQPVAPKQSDKTPPLLPNKPLPGATGNLTADHPAVVVLGKHCAACHTDGKLTDTTFTMFDPAGKLLEMSDRQWRKVSTKMATQKMPPEKDAAGKALPQPTPEEYGEVVKFIDGLK